MPYQPPIFQVYGTKRKAGENSDELQVSQCQYTYPIGYFFTLYPWLQSVFVDIFWRQYNHKDCGIIIGWVMFVCATLFCVNLIELLTLP